MPAKRTATKKANAQGKAKVVSKKAGTTKKPAIASKSAVKKASLAKKPAAKVIAKKAPSKSKPIKTAGTKTAGVKTPAKKITEKKPIKMAASKPVFKPPVVLQKSLPVANKQGNEKVIKKPPLSSKSKSSTSLAAGPIDFVPYQQKAQEEYMSPEMSQHFRGVLLRWKRELMEEVDRTVLHMKDEAANFPDPNDRATQEEEFSLELRTRDRERKLIKKIDEALARLDDNDYGYCETCGIEIGIKRLEARPTATMCIDCKTLEEIREKQMAS